MQVPEALRQRRQWVLWRTVDRDGKQTKVPYRTDGQFAKSTESCTWTDFEEACRCSGSYDGVGFVFSPDDPFCGIDLDGCRNPETGEIATWAKDVILKLDTYAEVSPSWTGVKLVLVGKSPLDRGRKIELHDAPRVCKKQPAIEVYDRARYFAITGKRLRGTPDPQDRQAALEAVCKQFFSEESNGRQDGRQSRTTTIERARKYLDAIPGAIAGQSGHNAAFRVACVLVLGFSLTKSEATVLMTEWNARCEPRWSEKELRHKIDSADKQAGKRGYLRDARDEDWSKIELPKYVDGLAPAAAAVSPVRVTTRQEAAGKYLSLIECGKGELVSTGIGEVDYAVGGGLEYGEMVIVAARPSHGKTAFALQFLDTIAQWQVPCAIISEEMSHIALGKRSIQYLTDTPEEHWVNRVRFVRSEIERHFSEQSPCYILEGCGRAEVAAEHIRQLAKDKGVRCVAVDYAQLLASRGTSRYEQITQTSITLRQVANETGALLIVLCQLSRAIESRTKFIPHLNDLKDSGQLEQDSDVILFLVWLHRIDSKAHKPHEYQVWIGKNRNRPILQEMVQCSFVPSRQRIMEAKLYTPINNFGEYSQPF